MKHVPPPVEIDVVIYDPLGARFDIKYIWEWPDEKAETPDVTESFRSVCNDQVKWQSWAREDGYGYPRDAKLDKCEKRILRYPRAFLCTLPKNDKSKTLIRNLPTSKYNLYDVGAQRNVYDDGKPIEVYPYVPGDGDWSIEITMAVNEDGTAINPPETMTYSSLDGYRSCLLPLAHYRKYEPTNRAILRFNGDSCELRILRLAQGMAAGSTTITRNKLLDDDGGDGSPPPSDPGDDGSEIAAYLAKRGVTWKQFIESLPAVKENK